MIEVRCLTDEHRGRFVGVADTPWSGVLRYVEHDVAPAPPAGRRLPGGVGPGHTTHLVLGTADGVSHVWARPHHPVVCQEAVPCPL